MSTDWKKRLIGSFTIGVLLGLAIASGAWSQDAASNRENFETQRRVSFCGHMWIIVEDYDEKGNRRGELSLHFSTEGYTINPTGQDAYPNGFAFSIESTRAADLRLIKMWRYQMQHEEGLLELPAVGPWSPVNSCVTQSLWWAWYGIEPNERVRQESLWPRSCTIEPDPDWTEKKRRIGLAWENAGTVGEHLDVLRQAMQDLFGASKDACFGE